MAGSFGEMDVQQGQLSQSPPTRIRTKRWTARMGTLLSSSRAASSGVFIVLMVVTDHLVAAADGYMNHNISGSYDPLVIASSENVVMLGVLCVLYTVLARRQYVDHGDWTSRVCWKELLSIGLLVGAEGILWALSSRYVTQQYQEAMTVVSVPLVFLVRFALYESYHIFHIAGAVYASLGLLCTAFASAVAAPATRSDVYYMGQVVVWSLSLLSMAHLFGRFKQMPVIGIVVVLLAVRLACTTIATVALLGSGTISGSAVACLLLGKGCDHAVPATLIGHALAMLLRLCSLVVVVKYVGAPIAVVTTVVSTTLRFYTHGGCCTSIDVAAAVLSVLGCGVFIHGQWVLEVAHNEEWRDQLRRSTASTSLVESSSSDGDDDVGPLMMHD